MWVFYSPGDIFGAIKQVEGKVNLMSEELSRLTAAVAAIDEKADSLIVLYKDVAAKLKAMASSATELASLKAAVNAAAGSLETQVAEIVAASASEPEPEPE